MLRFAEPLSNAGRRENRAFDPGGGVPARLLHRAARQAASALALRRELSTMTGVS
jgi:hypothetical protein